MAHSLGLFVIGVLNLKSKLNILCISPIDHLTNTKNLCKIIDQFRMHGCKMELHGLGLFLRINIVADHNLLLGNFHHITVVFRKGPNLGSK